MPDIVTFTINIPQILAYIPYMDPMGYISYMLWQPFLVVFFGAGASLTRTFISWIRQPEVFSDKPVYQTGG